MSLACVQKQTAVSAEGIPLPPPFLQGTHRTEKNIWLIEQDIQQAYKQRLEESN